MRVMSTPTIMRFVMPLEPDTEESGCEEITMLVDSGASEADARIEAPLPGSPGPIMENPNPGG
jgi:hypothetical protein